MNDKEWKDRIDELRQKLKTTKKTVILEPRCSHSKAEECKCSDLSQVDSNPQYDMIKFRLRVLLEELIWLCICGKENDPARSSCKSCKSPRSVTLRLSSHKTCGPGYDLTKDLCSDCGEHIFPQ